jgi:hypothetical protein
MRRTLRRVVRWDELQDACNAGRAPFERDSGRKSTCPRAGADGAM